MRQSTVPTHPLRGLDPSDSLDDLAPFLDLVGDARVVALGENNHHVREFTRLRHRLTRALVEHAGFTHYALESGFAEGFTIERWLRDGTGDLAQVADAGTTFLHGHATELHDMLAWMRAAGVHFNGLDVPCSAGSAAPAIDAVRRYLSDTEPEALGLADAALAATDMYAAGSNALSPGRYAALSVEQRDAATAAVSRLLAHMESLRPVHAARSGSCAQAVAEHHARGAWWLDQHQRELHAMNAAPSHMGAVSSRDTYMANTVRLLLDSDPSTKVVLGLHNGHLQRAPFTPQGEPVVISVGQQLSAALGKDYVAVGVTAHAGITPGITVDGSGDFGATLHEAALPEPEPESIEHALGEAGPLLLDLHRAEHTAEAPSSLRHADFFAPTPVFDAFDALVHLPTMRPSSFVTEPAPLEAS